MNRGMLIFKLTAVPAAMLGLMGCVSTKTAAVHPAPFFTATPVRQATNAVDAGDGNLEISALRRNMMSRPDDVDARLRLAAAYAKHGFPDVALEHYRLAAE